ncbi:glutamate-5-semialdehyde dehydrogenase [Ruminiclostridium cellulolyticum]|uniref:Gamma-glutamyl phosphate reductase n=1 Tax=Ruminiclostridium cellulolyticum (strain ATCC 35319 / DSM 5812 / JCM 6584 / H10) TaxID=394503 RepID=PROA_RUMCH|nr:glutamate-5-semialdehyde dehydrogenase [Ruminiclostridium cellulolyticum]B8I6T0.1 RecName: Full=Gamma-glutamyl phosphate reductase; Short=GPR; AltName: Full=Glutamate-5-semialdehyde dehydrogenase; AltName: Full=Glutamyl-gamma-semialdehyde dehydrogenase; Short=GSA dehydrogenase [Ruminiclostridium cellulolyticum H10]ACL76922.1 gamma-glutamyl phosphate reductase [Ruminiclostridium cellulolyticum H10]
MDIRQLCGNAGVASVKMAALSGEVKNNALMKIADALLANSKRIIEANQHDLERSEKENLASPLLKRLKFDEKKINDVVEGIKSLMALEEPIGKTLLANKLDDELELYKVTCPIGVIGIIFESRPDALVQISTLCLKSGNCVLLKGGSEAKETNRVLTGVIEEATVAAGLPKGWIGLLESRDDVNEMLKMDQFIDLIIPRGSNDFVRYIMDNSRIPVMGHADGICHVYVDESADLEMAKKITVDSKTQYVAVCNATETLLVDRAVAKEFLPGLKAELDKKNVEIFGDEETADIIEVKPASDQDWATEYLDYIISIKIVAGMDEAIKHIITYGSGHTDCIVTKDKAKAVNFMNLVDSGNVFWNASTRFSDGFKYGFGAEVGISTSKLHARGPVGLDGLLSYKYMLIGNGQIVDDYATNKRQFKHERMNKQIDEI